MMMDWTALYYDQLKGEKHLLIAPNTEHVMVTGIPDILSTMTTNIRSVMLGKTKRSTFTYDYDKETGALTVTVPLDQEQPFDVSFRHSQTISNTRRDFRWMVESNDFSQIECKFPYIPVPGKTECLQPIFWEKIDLFESGTVNPEGTAKVYSVIPPDPKEGHWTGYFVDMKFPGDTPDYSTIFKNEFHRSTPGFVWPPTLPFEDCYGETCIARMV